MNTKIVRTACVLSALSLCLLAGPGVMAKDKTDGVSSSLAVAKVICEKHFVASDAAYQEGIDVNGNPVAPADLSLSAPIEAPEYMEVPLSVELGQKMDLPLGNGVELNAVVGNLKLYTDGHVEYNGQDVSEKVATFCGVDTRTELAKLPPQTVRNDGVTEFKPVAGAVVPSSTSEEPAPKPAFDLPNHTVNMATDTPPLVTLSMPAPTEDQ